MTHGHVTADSRPELPLSGLRVVELADRLETCGRVLADLGADVIVVEPPGGAAARRREPTVEGRSLFFATHAANKRSVTLDLHGEAGRRELERLVATADLFVETTPPGTLEAIGLGAPALREKHPGLVVLSVTDFGQTGPYRDWIATNAVHTAMAGVLCRSGLPGLTPLLPPGSLAWECAAVQAAWVALLGKWQQLRAGVGDHLDFSIHEAVAQVFDPAMGMAGSANAGASALDVTPRDRPPSHPLYQILPCKDGWVRMCVLAPRQWEAMSAWLGPDHEFKDPAYASLAKRTAEASRLGAAQAKLFSRYTAAELAAEGQRRGVPIAAVQTPAQVLRDEHFEARGAFAPLEVAPGVEGRVPSGYLEVDGVRLGIRSPAPAAGQHTAEVLGALPRGHASWRRPSVRSKLERLPLLGLRVIDLGVIIVGAEVGRLFADMGAEVIKVESFAFPDGSRQSTVADRMPASFAQGHRNKLSMGVNLKSERGRDIFKRLAAKSDVVLSNFKPGTLESLGLGWDVLSQVNPRLVVADSSALGRTGPRSRSMGYGPLVRGTTGLTSLWRFPDVPSSFSDGVTVYPDHVAGRIVAVGVLALLLRRERTGRGGTVSSAQAEVFLNAMSEHFLRESLHPGSFVARGNASEFCAPEGVYPCAGEDEWCVVSVRDDADWKRLLPAIGREDLAGDRALATAAGRLARRAEVDAVVGAWTALRSPREVTRVLQAAGVPAGFMQRLTEFRDDPHFAARAFIRTMEHDGFSAPKPTENGPVKAEHIPDPPMRPAPYQAEHTREVAAHVLGMTDGEIEAAIAAGALEDMPPVLAKTA